MYDDWTMMDFLPLSIKNYEGRAIYFLFNCGQEGFQDQSIELVYIGQTKNLKKRLQVHDSQLNDRLYLGGKFIGELLFDSYFYIPLNSGTDERLILESFYIDKYQPKLNEGMCGDYVEGCRPDPHRFDTYVQR